MKGFAQLIEKEWLSFGHRFALRGGHDDDMSNPKYTLIPNINTKRKIKETEK
jgi:hypothetical protein